MTWLVHWRYLYKSTFQHGLKSSHETYPLAEEPLAVYSCWERASHFSLGVWLLVGCPCSSEWPYIHEHKTYPSITVVAYVFVLVIIFKIMWLVIFLQSLSGTKFRDTVCVHDFHIIVTNKPYNPVNKLYFLILHMYF